MKKGTLISFFIILAFWGTAQEPFIVTSDGIGRYGYVEADAVTYNKLTSNTYDNIDILAARWWAEGSEYIQEYIVPSCGGANTVISTTDFSHGNFPDWDAGEKAYVSVYVKYCLAGTWSQTGNSNRPDGQSGFNERQFMKVDVNTSGNITLASSIQDNTNNVVGTFIIDSGSEALTLDRLWLVNTGTAEEVNDISNDGIRIYYEAVTGTEQFDGTETNQPIYGNYGGNSASNNEFGSDDLNIPVAANTDLRCYVIITDLNDAYTAGRTAQFSIINDGISFEETLDGSYNLMRINQMDISASSISLPVELAQFRAQLSEQQVLLNWETVTETNNSHFEIEHSTDGKLFQAIGTVEGTGITLATQQYEFVHTRPVIGSNYYRLKQVDFVQEGNTPNYEYSKILHIENSSQEIPNITISPNPIINTLNIDNPSLNEQATIQIYTIDGRLTYQTGYQQSIDTSHLQNGTYILNILNSQNQLIYQSKLIK